MLARFDTKMYPEFADTCTIVSHEHTFTKYHLHSFLSLAGLFHNFSYILCIWCKCVKLTIFPWFFFLLFFKKYIYLLFLHSFFTLILLYFFLSLLVVVFLFHELILCSLSKSFRRTAKLTLSLLRTATQTNTIFAFNAKNTLLLKIIAFSVRRFLLFLFFRLLRYSFVFGLAFCFRF